MTTIALARTNHSSRHSVASKPMKGTGGARRNEVMDLRSSEATPSSGEQARHSSTPEKSKSVSTDTLCAAHSRAYRRYVLATEARARIKKAPNPRIGMYVLRRVQPNAGIFPLLKKGEFRTAFVLQEAWSHKEIDSFAAQYIRVARKAGKWSLYHDPIHGRLDDDGVFHELGSSDCPLDGKILCKPSKHAPSFDAASLAEYRQHRIPQLHAALDAAISEMNQQDAKSGWTAANEEWVAARGEEWRAWCKLLQRVHDGKRDDVTKVCAHQKALLRRENARILSDNKTSRFLDEVENELALKAQGIIDALCGDPCRPRGEDSLH